MERMLMAQGFFAHHLARAIGVERIHLVVGFVRRVFASVENIIR